MIQTLKKQLHSHINPEKAEHFPRFFKTGKGEYGEGDLFLGITVPNCRSVAKKFKTISIQEVETLITSKYHEERLVALLILIEKYNKANEKEKKEIVDYYLSKTKHINNWDLVDLSCYKILGEYLLDKDRSILYKLAKSKDLWEKRIGIITTMAFIRKNQFEDTMAISEILVNDDHDLIHKAVGWLLREVGKRDMKVEEKFLKKYYKNMPRTMLRYAIEKFPEDKRQKYLKGQI